MAVSRLLQAKSELHLQRVGLVSPTRWFCSTSSNNGDAQKSSQSKKPPRNRRLSLLNHSRRRYMETHPGTFPKATQVQNKVGGSWYTLKDVLSNLKEKMLGNPQLQNHPTNDASDSTVDATVLEKVQLLKVLEAEKCTAERTRHGLCTCSSCCFLH
ncbi:unnamed protein product [Camellia sinensis]